jgi:HK97 family phage major capsid protein
MRSASKKEYKHMTYKEIIEKRNHLLQQAGTAAQAAKTKEERSKVTVMLTDADALTEEANIAQRLETYASESRAAGRPPRGNPGEFTTSNDVAAQKSALRDWMRTGNISQENRSHLRESRDVGAGVGVGIGSNTISSSVLVPVGMDPVLSAAKKSYGIWL